MASSSGYPSNRSPNEGQVSATSSVRSPKNGAPMELSPSQTSRLTKVGPSRSSERLQKANLESALTDEVLLPVWWESSRPGPSGGNTPATIAVSPGMSVYEVARSIGKELGVPREQEIQLSVHRTLLPRLPAAHGPDAAAGGRVVMAASGEFTAALLEAVRATDGLAMALKRRTSRRGSREEARVQQARSQHVQKAKSTSADRQVEAKADTKASTKAVSFTPQEAESDCSSSSEIWDLNSERRCTRKTNDVFRFGGKELHGKFAVANDARRGRFQQEDEGTFLCGLDCVERTESKNKGATYGNGGDDREVKTQQEMDDEEAECDMCFARPRARQPQFKKQL